MLWVGITLLSAQRLTHARQPSITRAHARQACAVQRPVRSGSRAVRIVRHAQRTLVVGWVVGVGAAAETVVMVVVTVVAAAAVVAVAAACVHTEPSLTDHRKGVCALALCRRGAERLKLASIFEVG